MRSCHLETFDLGESGSYHRQDGEEKANTNALQRCEALLVFEEFFGDGDNEAVIDGDSQESAGDEEDGERSTWDLEEANVAVHGGCL